MILTQDLRWRALNIGEPRFKNDIDVVVQLSGDQADALAAEFPPADRRATRE